jgi:hypothetical protein
MESTNVMGQLQRGMAVWTADGHKLGKIVAICCGSDQVDCTGHCDDEHCSHLEIHTGRLGKGLVLYVPCYAVAHVTGKQVWLNVDAATVHEQGSWTRRPLDQPIQETLGDFEHEMAGIATSLTSTLQPHL